MDPVDVSPLTSIRGTAGDPQVDPDAPAPADLKAAATELADGFPAPLPGLIAATEPENVQRWVLRDRTPLKQWSKGRITLCGDAAHATSPHVGQGGAMAMEDAIVLAEEVTTGDGEAALERYVERRYPRCREIWEISRQIGTWEIEHTPPPEADFVGLTIRSVHVTAATSPDTVSVTSVRKNWMYSVLAMISAQLRSTPLVPWMGPAPGCRHTSSRCEQLSARSPSRSPLSTAA